ncbi:MAG: hypothetical protein A2Y07_03735 [Planctomycetes bacterium GWF2_50_10]|nr:MAG: hypothetical protein A2Y07_03735 [Planctomycetes bacterium GWF2_50_10]
MGHGPSSDWSFDRASSFKTRVGIWMFLLYAIIYAGFIIVNTFDPQIMGSDIGGYNLAILYGFGLIVFALMLAFVYNATCTAAEEELNGPTPDLIKEEEETD